MGGGTGAQEGADDVTMGVAGEGYMLARFVGNKPLKSLICIF